MDPKRPDYAWWEDDPSDPCKWTTIREQLIDPPINRADLEPWTKLGVRPNEDDQRDWRGVRRKDVRELAMPEETVLEKGIPYQRYYFFDTPDYADPFAKIWSAMKWSLYGGGIVAAFNGASFISFYNSNMPIPKYVFRNALYFSAAGLITSTSVICIANLRGKKDDYWNWVGAGFVTAMCMGNSLGWGSWFRWCVYGIPGLVVLKRAHEGMYGGTGDSLASGDFRVFNKYGLNTDRARRSL